MKPVFGIWSRFTKVLKFVWLIATLAFCTWASVTKGDESGTQAWIQAAHIESVMQEAKCQNQAGIAEHDLPTVKAQLQLGLNPLDGIKVNELEFGQLAGNETKRKLYYTCMSERDKIRNFPVKEFDLSAAAITFIFIAAISSLIFGTVFIVGKTVKYIWLGKS
jgi:hypothetical protein